jgi:hypothetical protein
MIKYGKTKDCVLTIATSATISAACDLGLPCEYISVYLPALDSTTIGLQVSLDGVTYKQLGIGTVATSATTGEVFTTITVGGFQFIKFVCGTTQSTGTTRTFVVRGYRG